ncbi:hypothetical protein [Streptomyces sp. NPDC005209]|uniref:hypothetical protein n=1 Tax=Streptomyces sp. NPDC005209 TaxID=3156715 RepID=UPI0033A795E0
MRKPTGTASMRLDPHVWGVLEDRGVSVSPITPAAPLIGPLPGVKFSMGSGEVNPTGNGEASFPGGIRLENDEGAFIELTHPRGTIPHGRVDFAVKTSNGNSAQRVQAFEYSLVNTLEVAPLELSFAIHDTQLKATQDFADLIADVLHVAAVDAGDVFAIASAEFGLKKA